MRDVRSTCTPGPELLAGTFNPEIFTAGLSRVLVDYAKGRAKPGAASLYSDPAAFFRDATYEEAQKADSTGETPASSASSSAPPRSRSRCANR